MTHITVYFLSILLFFLFCSSFLCLFCLYLVIFYLYFILLASLANRHHLYFFLPIKNGIAKTPWSTIRQLCFQNVTHHLLKIHTLLTRLTILGNLFDYQSISNINRILNSAKSTKLKFGVVRT